MGESGRIVFESHYLHRRIINRLKHYVLFVIWAATLDGLSKLWATFYAPVTIYNTEIGRYGFSESQLTLITLAILLATTVLVYRLHDRAPGLNIAIGVMIGGSLGNFISRLTGPPGVLDFIPFGGYSLGNLADIWIIGGAAAVWAIVYVTIRRENHRMKMLRLNP